MAVCPIIGFLALICFNLDLIKSLQPNVTIENGKILGLYKKSKDGNRYESYEGIPYAEPPVNENRFKEPMPYTKKWQGYKNASAPSAPCLQVSHFVKEGDHYGIVGSEDCLYLNIYVKRSRNVKNQLSDVIVFIQPGTFSFSFKGGAGPDYIMDEERNVISPVVLVTFNYRLGPFGFLSTGDTVVPGNNGLKDQLLVLKWVKNNIKLFGGNPKRITIAGLSAGGASVHYMMLTPLTNGLFHRAVSFSGTAFCPWALIHDVPQKSKKLAELLKCPTSSNEMVSCLRQKPGDQILKQMKHFQKWLYNPFTIFGPMIESKSPSAIISEHPVDIMWRHDPNATIGIKKIPWMISVVRQEGLYPGAEFVFNASLLNHLNDHWDDLAPSLLFYNDSNSNRGISHEMRRLYLRAGSFSASHRDEIIDMMSDRLFIAPAVNTAYLAQAYSIVHEFKNPVYFYMFTQKVSVPIASYQLGPKVANGAGHGDDVSLIFKLGGIESLIGRDEMATSLHLREILLKFAKTGKPPKKWGWNPVILNFYKSFSYLQIDNWYKIKLITADYLKVPGNPGNIGKVFREEKSASVGRKFEEAMKSLTQIKKGKKQGF